MALGTSRHSRLRVLDVPGCVLGGEKAAWLARNLRRSSPEVRLLAFDGALLGSSCVSPLTAELVGLPKLIAVTGVMHVESCVGWGVTTLPESFGECDVRALLAMLDITLHLPFPKWLDPCSAILMWSEGG